MVGPYLEKKFFLKSDIGKGRESPWVIVPIPLHLGETF
jgi:hypothetical protein